MSGRANNMPREGSSAHVALKCLHELEGQASEARWRDTASRLLGAKAKTGQWDAIIQTLINTDLVFLRRGLCIVTDDGLALLGTLGAAVEVVPRAEPLNVPARYVPPMRPLSAKYRPNVHATRDGAFDYRGIPSLHGDDRVAYQTSLKVAQA